MTEVLTAAEMRAVEGAAIDSGPVTGLALMERAGAGVVAAMLSRWPDLSIGQRRAVVLCGPGNNGGDGFVIARLLRQADWAVEVFLLGDSGKLPPDARRNFERWARLGTVKPLTKNMIEDQSVSGSCDVLIDALFGTGLARTVSLPLHRLGGHQATYRTVAVDIPSGLCGDSGRVIGLDDAVLRADLTVSFHRFKLGHMLAQGPAVCGHCVVADIGL